MEKIPAAYREIPKHMKLMQLMASRWQKPAHALCRLRAKYERYTAVNSFGKGTPHISLSFLEHPAKEKSDGISSTNAAKSRANRWSRFWLCAASCLPQAAWQTRKTTPNTSWKLLILCRTSTLTT